MKLSSFIIRHRKTIVILWAVIILASTPALLGYSHYITYSSSGAVNPNSESQIASQILEKSHTTNSSLVILVLQNPFLNNSTAARTLSMQKVLQNSGIMDLASTTSPFSAYASFINAAIGRNATIIAGLYNETRINATAMYSFPSAFYSSWSSHSYTYDSIMASALDAGFNSSMPYETAFISELNRTAGANNVSGNESVSEPLQAVMSAILIAYNESYPQYQIGEYSPGSYISYHYLGLNNYSDSVSVAVAGYLRQYFPATPDLVNATISGGNIGINYVRMYGLAGAPQYLTDQYVSSDRSAFIVSVIFSVPSGYVGKGDFEPSANATPAVEKITSNYFGNSGMVTGNGAINQQIQQVTARSAFIFGVLFVILAIAVAITLVSWKSALVALIFVSLATALGYVSIFITGIILHGVNYIVNYTLTAVAVGVSTDYLIYIASRYRQEIREGANNQDALSTAVSRAGRAVVISGVTVSLSLLTFSFIPGFRSWGLVLFMAILMIVALVATLFPAILALFGPGFFTRKSISRVQEGYHTKSVFHRAARLASRRRVAVVAVILLLGIPAGYFFFTVPTTYNFNTGVPAGLPAVKALNTLETKFGSNLIYPIEVILPMAGTNWTNATGTNTTILSTTQMLLDFTGVHKVVGPYSNGTSLNSSISPSPFTLDGGRYVYYLVYSDYSPYSAQALQQVTHLREDKSIIVGGITSSVIDQKAENAVTYGELEILIVAVIFAVLTVSFRSLRYPIISISGVFISISWTTAILYFISTYILHQALIYLIPIILFIILMSLGNDYTVFIVSSVREYSSKMGFREGMPRGMASSGKVVTSLGLILAASLGSLAFIPDGFLEQLGISFIISLLIDTFIIRTLYFPSMLSIFHMRKEEIVLEEKM